MGLRGVGRNWGCGRASKILQWVCLLVVCHDLFRRAASAFLYKLSRDGAIIVIFILLTWMNKTPFSQVYLQLSLSQFSFCVEAVYNGQKRAQTFTSYLGFCSGSASY